MTLIAETVAPDARPRLDLMRSRVDTDWGEAPKYNEAYRKIRWPGIQSHTMYYRPLTVEEIDARRRGGRDAWNAPYESPLMPGYTEMPAGDPGITVTRRLRNRPIWMGTIARQRNMKASGRWTRNMSKQTLYGDIKFCMSENIPFKTKTFEYKPSDQWLYVHGIPVLKYSLVTGQITHFTFSGVYNKVTSLLFRMFEIYVRLKGRKVTWFHQAPGRRPRRVRPGSTPPTPFHGEVDIDINRVYTYSDFYRDAPIYKGFITISSTLYNEFYRTEIENNGREVRSGNGHQRAAEPASEQSDSQRY